MEPKILKVKDLNSVSKKIIEMVEYPNGKK